MREYDFLSIEKKWQKRWAEEKYGRSEDFGDKPKHYHLVEFPYPSGAGLHVGHCMGYGASDAYCRMKRMQGYNVMYPMGWDAFGLPTENYAIKNKIKPQKATADNIANFKNQMKSLGYAFDWSREVNTTDPDYYRWTQWIFLQFYKHGIVADKLVKIADDDTTTPRLAFQAEMPVNWCPSCKIVLANEEVVAGNCERCGAQSTVRKQKQWMLRITAYADRLIKDLDTVDYLQKIKTQQINWIGKSYGSSVVFKVKGRSGTISDEEIEVFTTRPDTLFGATYVVLSPEHPLIEKLGHHIQNFGEVMDYIEDARKKSDLERTELQKEKTGVKLFGILAINPINNEEVPVYVADYVLASYGTGAMMAVPAHDERDFEFAKKYNIEIREVIIPVEGETHEGEEFRNTVSAVIHRKSDDKFLLLKWKKQDWISFPLGGVESGESKEEAVAREVLEETGYKVRPIEKLGGIIESHFYADHKKVWRSRHDQPFLCELISEEQVDQGDEEKDILEPIWLSSKEALKQTTHPYNKLGLIRYLAQNYAYTDKQGILINSGGFDGMQVEEAKEKIIEWLEKNNAGKKAINFKLRDWIFSRQHYWGEPIPVIYCAECAKNHQVESSKLKVQSDGIFTIIDGKEHMIVPVPEDQLPVTLPDVENYEPTDTGESPLAKMTDWVNTTCPKCGGPAKRETDTMPNWAGSSWYFLAYAMNNELGIRNYGKEEGIFNAKQKELKYWTPVDMYNGGMEHTTLHLLYSRFWHKFLYDLGAAHTPEPYTKRIAHGIILGPDGRKMSKSFGNVINPDDIAKKFGADTLRAYIMFIGPYDQESAWSMAGVQGVYRFLKRVWKNIDLLLELEPHPVSPSKGEEQKELLIKLNQSIAGISDDLESFRMNTVVSKLMELNNTIEKSGHISRESYSVFLRLLSPACPHIASELWQSAGFDGDISKQPWPQVDKNYLVADQIEIAIQINGRLRDKILVSPDISDDELKEKALDSEKTKNYVEGKEIRKVIVVPKKLVSIVISEKVH